MLIFFFFSSRRRHTRLQGDWSSDVCSSDLIAAQDGCTIKLDASGAIVAATGVTEQGQGTETIMAQIAATALGVEMSCVKVLTGDTDKVPYGGGTWASRAAGIGRGEEPPPRGAPQDAQ